MRLNLKVFFLPVVCLAILLHIPKVVGAEKWLEFYRSGPVTDGKVAWNLNEVDVDSIVAEGKFLKYKVRVRYSDGKLGEFGSMQASCSDGTRGQFPSPRMSPTYKGTQGGD